MKSRLTVVLAGLLVFSGSAHAESTRYFQIEGFGALLNGERRAFHLISMDGWDFPPEMREVWNRPESMVTAASLWRGGIVVAQREAPHLLWVDIDGTEVTLVENWHAPITALAAVGGRLVIGQSAPGALFEISNQVKSPPYWLIALPSMFGHWSQMVTDS